MTQANGLPVIVRDEIKAAIVISSRINRHLIFWHAQNLKVTLKLPQQFGVFLELRLQAVVLIQDFVDAFAPKLLSEPVREMDNGYVFNPGGTTVARFDGRGHVARNAQRGCNRFNVSVDCHIEAQRSKAALLRQEIIYFSCRLTSLNKAA